MDTQGHHLCWGHMSFRYILQQHRVPSLMDAVDPGPAWTEVTHCTPSPAPHRDTSGDQGPPRLGLDPALGQPSCLDTAPVNTGQVTNSSQCPVPAASPSPAHPSPVPFPH